MTPRILKAALQVSFSSDSWVARLSTLKRTTLVLGLDSWTLRDQALGGTLHHSASEFIRQDALKSIRHWVDIVKPAKPDLLMEQLGFNDDVAREDNEEIESHTCDPI